MIALDTIGHGELRDLMWSCLREFARTGTNDVSFAHLEAAADGYGAAALHDLLSNLLTGTATALGRNLVAIDRIGHSSGWDGLAGMLIVLRSYRDARFGNVAASPEFCSPH
jgi:hypothetical protein